MKSGPSAPKEIDDYIAGFPEHIQRKLQEIRTVAREVAPDAEEAIKYGMPTLVLNGCLIHFAAFKKHIGVYPVPREHEEFREELAAYPGSKDGLSLKFDEPVPLDLIRRIVEFRVAESLARAALRKRQH